MKKRMEKSAISALIEDGHVKPQYARELVAVLKRRGWILMHKRQLVLIQNGIKRKIDIIIKLMELDLKEKARKRYLIGLIGKL